MVVLAPRLRCAVIAVALVLVAGVVWAVVFWSPGGSSQTRSSRCPGMSDRLAAGSAADDLHRP